MSTPYADPGDGGMRRALVIAGADRQLASLWKVSDEVTRDMMIAYYEELLAGEDHARAFRGIHLEMLRDRVRGRPYLFSESIR